MTVSVERFLEALGDPDLARFDERFDARDVPQHVVAASDADRRPGGVALEPDWPVVDGDPQLGLRSRLRSTWMPSTTVSTSRGSR